MTVTIARRRVACALITAAVGLLSACTTAGPFVTSIASAGNGELSVEKCMAEFNAFLGVISTKNCQQQKIHVPIPNHVHPDSRRR